MPFRPAARPLLVYISAHGFGHAVRVGAVLRAFHARLPDVPILVRAAVDPAFLAAELDVPCRIAPARLDVGVVQADSLSPDPAATLSAARALCEHAASLIADELAALSPERPAVVLADIPALAFDVAAALGVPGIAMANFTWDWIYAAYAGDWPAFAPVIAALRASYAQATLLLRLPWHGEMPAFARVRDVPLVARRPRLDPDAVRRRLGLPPRDRIVLLSFGGFGLSLPEVPRRAGVTFVATESARAQDAPAGCRTLTNRELRTAGVRYEDLVAASDAVLTKPGYGIVADCCAAGTPIVYTDRGPFAEYPILVEAIRAHLPHAFLPSADLVAGRWGAALDSVLDVPRRSPSVDLSGAEQVADVLAAHCSGA